MRAVLAATRQMQGRHFDQWKNQLLISQGRLIFQQPFPGHRISAAAVGSCEVPAGSTPGLKKRVHGGCREARGGACREQPAKHVGAFVCE